GKGSYACLLADEALGEIVAEVCAWARQGRRDADGSFSPWPWNESPGMKKLDLAREFFVAAMDAEKRLLRLEYDARTESHWIIYPHAPGNPEFQARVHAKPGQVRQLVSEACDRVLDKIYERNRSECWGISE